jgi:CBS domain-containing protein
MRASEIMTSPAVTVTPGTTLKDVARLLVEQGVNAVPVVDADERLVGIVSEADLLALETAPASGRRPHTVREVMTHPVYTLAEETDAVAAARLMLRHRLKSVPVVAGERVVGMVARRDLLRLLARSDDDIRSELERRLAEEARALHEVGVEVSDGVVTVEVEGDPCRLLVESVARAIPGVVEVRSRPGSRSKAT